MIRQPKVSHVGPPSLWLKWNLKYSAPDLWWKGDLITWTVYINYMACLSKINPLRRSIEPGNVQRKWLLENATKGHKNLSVQKGREEWERQSVTRPCHHQRGVCYPSCLISPAMEWFISLEDTEYKLKTDQNGYTSLTTVRSNGGSFLNVLKLPMIIF